jgi:hypothetical protein
MATILSILLNTYYLCATMARLIPWTHIGYSRSAYRKLRKPILGAWKLIMTDQKIITRGPKIVLDGTP